MIKSLRAFGLCTFFLSITLSQDLCPPALVDALFYDEKIELSWDQTTSWGDLLYEQCFASCSLASEAMTVVHVDSMCGACSGGWFRFSDGSEADCGEGMYPCQDGGTDDFSAYAGYSGTDSTTEMYAQVDSRLITNEINLTGYSSAFIEFTEAYTYPEDANDSNMVEISIDGGITWDVVFVSDPSQVGEDFFSNGIDISEYVGNTIHIAFRYYDSVGYGEAWFVDDIRVWGNEGDPNDPNFDPNMCGTFNHYNVYMDGALIGTVDSSEFTVENLENDVEYCFTITTSYDEGESDPSYEVCSTPRGPFQVSPLSLSSEQLMAGQYVEYDLTIANFDTARIDFDLSSIELSNVDAAMDIIWDDMENYFAIFSDADGLWSVGDSLMASSTYLSYDIPDNGGQFGYYNDDAAGDNGEVAFSMLESYDFPISSIYPPILMFDLFFPNPSGPCEDGGTYADDFLVHVSTDQGSTWTLIDSTLSTGYDWFSYMINLQPYLNGSSQFRVGLQYSDCGGNWAYGVGIDNVRIKEGDDFTWLTVSPYSGTVDFAGHSVHDSISVKVGMYGVFDGFSIEDELLIDGISRHTIPDEYSITVQLAVGAMVSLKEPKVIPFEFALHQNYPNPFNPETKIQFDIAEKSHVTIAVFNLVGQKVATLANSSMDVGKYTLIWGGLDDRGVPIPSGVYFYEMSTSSYHSIKKLVLVK